jgi:hypothetical protein
VVGAEERRVSAGFGHPGDRELVVVGGALLRFDEDAEVHPVSLWVAQKKSTLSVLTNMPWPVTALVKRVPLLSASMVQPTAV